MDLSIIIVNYNTAELVKSCVNKLLKDTKNLTSPQAEIILIENASPEKPLKDDWKNERIQLITNKENLGFAKAVNQGMNVSKGRHVLLLNSDTELKSGSINDLVKFADSKEDAGIVGAKLILPTGEVQKSVFRFPTIWRAVQEFLLGQKDKFSSFVPSGNVPVKVEAIVGAVFLITNKAKEKVGLFDERYFMYFEDLDYCKRVSAAGLSVYYLPTVEFFHHHGASGKNLADSANQWRRLIPASKTYHGLVKHSIITLILKVGQKLYPAK